MTALTGLSTLSALTAQSGAVSIDALRLLPALAPALGALLVLLVDALAPRRTLPHLVVGALALLMGAAGAMPGALSPAREPVLTLCLPGGPDGACLWSAGPLDSTLQIGLLAAGLAALPLLSDQWRDLPGDRAVDVALILASAAGGAAVVAARELGTWLVALELATLPVIALVVLRGTRRAAHGGMTLMMTSLLSFAVLVVGTGLWVMATGDASLSGTAIRTAWAEPDQRAVLVVAILTLFVGLGFKLSLVPFHAWTPPTFVSGPLPISALLATASKLAAVGALLALIAPFAGLADPHPHALAFVVGALAIGSMLVGTVVAFRATDLVRLLAWSTIAQAGWVVLPLAALTTVGHRAAVAYALTYAAAGLVAFAVATAVRTAGGEPGSERGLAAYRGLARSHPHVGGPLILALLTLAGLPPAILGLVAKVVAIRPLLAAGLWPLAVLAVIAVVLGIAVYVRWIAVLLAAPEHGTTAASGNNAGTGVEVQVGPGALAVLSLGTALLVVASVVPQVLYGLLS